MGAPNPKTAGSNGLQAKRDPNPHPGLKEATSGGDMPRLLGPHIWCNWALLCWSVNVNFQMDFFSP
jgi:hypothetical protein